MKLGFVTVERAAPQDWDYQRSLYLINNPTAADTDLICKDVMTLLSKAETILVEQGVIKTELYDGLFPKLACILDCGNGGRVHYDSNEPQDWPRENTSHRMVDTLLFARGNASRILSVVCEVKI